MTRRRKVLCIVTPNHWKGAMGGAEYQIACLLDVLVASGRFDVWYLTRCIDPEFRPDGYRIVQIGSSGHAPRLGYTLDAPRIYRSLARIQPDVVYQRVACGYTGISAFYSRRRGARFIWHVAHDSDVIRSASLDTGRNVLRRRIEKRSIEYGIRHASAIVAQTQQQARLLEGNYGRVAAAVVPNFHPEPREPLDKSGPLTVVWVANLKRWKQPEVFVRLAAKLGDIPGIRFIMAGAGATGSGAGGQSWNDAVMASIGSTPNLEYVGEKSQDEVNALLARAHLLVNTSVQEGFSNTFIQAWMREVPVVSLKADPDGILGREGIGICAGSEEQLAPAVRTLLTDPERRKVYASRAHKYAALRHSIANAGLLMQLMETGKIESTGPAPLAMADTLHNLR